MTAYIPIISILVIFDAIALGSHLAEAAIKTFETVLRMNRGLAIVFSAALLAMIDAGRNCCAVWLLMSLIHRFRRFETCGLRA